MNYTRIINVALVLLVSYVVVQKVLVWRKGEKQVGQAISLLEIPIIQSNGAVTKEFPVTSSERKVLVFWATWCGPCSIELARIQNLIDSNEISADKVIAVSSGEDQNLLLATALERKYTFPIGVDFDGKFSKQFNISATPTTVFVVKYKISEITVGFSPLLESSIKTFIKK